jgi:hypothetical protein
MERSCKITEIFLRSVSSIGPDRGYMGAKKLSKLFQPQAQTDDNFR